MKSVYLKLALLCCALGCTKHKEVPGALVVEPGLKSLLVAKEPLIIDPVAFAVDELGHMFVVEHRGYPDPAEGGKPASNLGQVARLSDKDGDGIYDDRDDFVDGLTYPNGILAWKGGVFVTCAPDIFYFKDTTGDGVADIKDVVLTGFFDTKTAQIRMSHPTLGLDGWVYVTGGLNGGKITSPEYPDRPAVEYTSSDGRFNPETFEFETVTGKSQFGITIDAYGRRFGCSNRHPVMQAMMESTYLNRNPYLLFNETVTNVSKVQAEAVVYPISGAVITADYIPSLMGRSHQGTFTAASGTYVFSDDGLGSDRKGNIFICESAQNMVQRQVLSPDGPTFTSTIAQDGVEFIASKDEWFRPVFLGAGPYPGLYVVDMHRKIIDHPSYVPEAMRDQLDFISGADKGRIYRILPKLPQKIELPVFQDTKSLLQHLESNLEWVRMTAFRLLLERKPRDVTAALRKMALESEYPESRVRALWMLHHMGQLDDEMLHNASKDAAAGVIEQVVLFAAMAQQPAYQDPGILLSFAHHDNARVRFLTALELGNFADSSSTEALAQIAAKDGADVWTRAAVLSGIGDRMSDFLTAFQHQPNIDPEVRSAVMQEMGAMLGNGANKETMTIFLRQIISKQSDGDWTIAAAAGLAKGIYARKEFILHGTINILQSIFTSPQKPLDGEELEKFLDHARSEITNIDASIETRKFAIDLLGYAAPSLGFALFSDIMADPSQARLHADIVQSLTRQGLDEGAQILTSKKLWPTMTPAIRSLVLSALISKKGYIPTLYQAIEEKVIQTSEISSSDRQRLLHSTDLAVSEKATSLFDDLEGGQRMQVYESYRKDLTAGNAKIGTEVFQRSCAVCHSYAGKGGKVGPDLTGVKNQPPEALLMHTLVPNYEVYPNYMAVILETKSGDSFAGWIETESDNSLTLRTAAGAQITILRPNIASLTSTGKSLMPDGLELTMTKQEMMDLITFLRSGG